MTIAQTDPRAAYLERKDEIDAALQAALIGGRYINGPAVASFEAELGAFLGVPHAIGVASGTDAVHLALRALGVGPGDRVVTVSHTAVATVAAIELAGAEPVLVDIDAQHFTMSPASLEDALTEGQGRVKAVVVVHLYGQPADLDEVHRITRRHGVFLVEDCAQSHGATHGDAMAGSIGDIAAFSFYPTKNLGALGDGGAVATRDPALAARARLLREYGWRERYISEVPGMNTRLDELQAAILRVRLRYLGADNERRRAIAHTYDRLLPSDALGLPQVRPGVTHVYHQYVVRSRHRDALRAHLQREGVGTAVHYPLPVHAQPAYRGRVALSGSLANTERACQEILSLPMYPQLTSVDVERVCAAVRAFAAE